jgi:hypothetical protein
MESLYSQIISSAALCNQTKIIHFFIACLNSFCRMCDIIYESSLLERLHIYHLNMCFYILFHFQSDLLFQIDMCGNRLWQHHFKKQTYANSFHPKCLTAKEMRL